MKCVICKHGQTTDGVVTVTLHRDRTTLVIRGVPAQVCTNCGEQYLDAPTSTQLLQAAENAAQAGVEVDIRQFQAA